MLGQTFALSDVPQVAALSFLEILLSADNAIVLAVLVSKLGKEARQKALYIGLFSSLILRAGCLAGLAFLIQYSWMQIAGAVYLLYLAISYFCRQPPLSPSSSPGFWKTVVSVELLDLVFALDSMIAGLAFIEGSSSLFTLHPKLWIVYAGGAMGLFGVRYAAKAFSALLTRFRRLEIAAHLMIGWIGLKLGYLAIPHLPPLSPLFWTGLALLFLFGFTRKK